MRKFFFGPATLAALAVTASLTVAEAQVPGEHFIENWDLDGNGSVSVEEAKERRSDVFATFDSDEDGYLSAEEYVTFDEARETDMAENGGGGGRGMHRAADGMKLEANDIDGDGKVSKDEFIDQAAAWHAMLDRNGDGKVTTDDFGR